ncbi:FAD-dependent oxidoreductase [Candidatus Saccharibacteria bacterium]|nr:FAD-dependent oxidoreductase [Candidatus Saccharibacteria bacterium]
MGAEAAERGGEMTGEAEDVIDVIVVGAGPAGLSAALSLAREHFSVLVLEKAAIGGNLLKIADLENYAGFRGPGAELARVMKEQVKSFGGKIDYASAIAISSGTTSVQPVATGEPRLVLGLPASESPLEIATAEPNKTYRAKAVIVANGMRARELSIPGLRAAVHGCATCDGPVYKDKKVAVIGGGDSAFQTALFLASMCSSVYIISRSKPRVKGTLLKRAEENQKITILTETTATKELLDEKLQIAGVFLEIGSERQELPKVAAELEGAANVFYAGDCHEGVRRQVVSAAADGAEAAEKAREWLASQ